MLGAMLYALSCRPAALYLVPGRDFADLPADDGFGDQCEPLRSPQQAKLHRTGQHRGYTI